MEKYNKESILKENNTEQKQKINLCGTLKPITKISCKDYYWHIINKAKHEPTSKTKWSDIYSIMNSKKWIMTFGKELFKCPSILVEKQKYKLSS